MKQLVVAGTGIKALSHFTREIEAAITQAEVVLYLVNEPLVSEWIEANSSNSVSLEDTYYSKPLRKDSYKAVVDKIHSSLSIYSAVCFVVYGHPLLLSCSVSQLLLSMDRNSVNVTVLPSVSSLDCLMCDLEVDPGEGLLSVEANAFMKKPVGRDNSYHLVLWQVGILNDRYSIEDPARANSLELLRDKLLECYPSSHIITFYEASLYPHVPPKVITLPISEMVSADVSRLTTAYIAPLNAR